MTRRGEARRSIAVQVWGMVLVAGALLAGLIVVNTQADQARERDLVTRDLDRRLAQTATLLDGELEEGSDTEETLTEVAAQPGVASLGAACVAALDGLQRAIEFGYLEVVDGSGRVLCTPRADHRTTTAPWAGSALLADVRLRQVATGAPVRDPYTGVVSLYTVVPLATDEPASLLYAVPTQTALMPDSDDGSVQWLAVHAPSGQVLMAVPERTGLVGSALTDRSPLGAVGQRALLTSAGQDGERRLFRGTRLTDSDIVLLVSAEESAAYASAQTNLRRNLAFGAALLLVLAALGAVLQRRVVRPARALRSAIEAAGRGEAAVAPTDGPSELAVLGSAFNTMLAARRRHELELAHEAAHDPLTGLPNRRQVTERLAERIAGGEPCAAVFVDLDRFKLVNDAHGHGTGDEVLCAVGRHLVEATHPGEVVGRFGGDEFVVVVGGVTERGALEVAERLAGALARPVEVGGRELFVCGSVGIALRADGEDAETVLHHADTAMYRAKGDGQGRAAVFDDAMREVSATLLRTETDLHRALERDELRLHLQPVVDLADGTVTGAEALVRWQHPERGLVPPLDFIGVAEQTGLIVPIGGWVLRQACHWAATTSEQLGRPLTVSVNVSAHQLGQPDFAAAVSDALLTTGLAPEQLCLEVTESVLVHDADRATEALGTLRSQGVRVAIDDFGTGWSSLTYLQTLPVDEIKLDRSYVSRLPDEPTASAIVTSLVGMAHVLGLSVTAEGVETPEQLAFLAGLACEKAQGYLFQRPVDAAAVLPALSRTDWLSQT